MLKSENTVPVQTKSAHRLSIQLPVSPRVLTQRKEPYGIAALQYVEIDRLGHAAGEREALDSAHAFYVAAERLDLRASDIPARHAILLAKHDRCQEARAALKEALTRPEVSRDR